MNATVSLISRKTSPSEVLDLLIARYGISRRQAYRYFQQAQEAAGPVPVPESKGVFTVKLPLSLIRQVRQQTGGERGGISRWVEKVLRQSLHSARGHGPT